MDNRKDECADDIIRPVTAAGDTPVGYRGGVRPASVSKWRKWRFLIVAAIALFGLFQAFTGAGSLAKMFPDRLFAHDLRMRRNEVRCAHQGVSPFRIWNREVSLPGIVPANRPDKEKVERTNESDIGVQGYPPWHTAFFWFYGWLPKIMCISLMSVVFGICLAFIVSEGFRLSQARSVYPGLVVGFALAFIADPAAQCFIVLNYGVMILSAFLLMNRALEKNHAVLAGLAWAVMMIKPQMGLLFVWPLFWHRRYLTIATAAAVCLAGAVFTSFAVHESVIYLVLQLPEIGRQYMNGGGVMLNKIIRLIAGDGARFLVPALFFVAVGYATWSMRKERDFLACCVPVTLVSPLWTYCQDHDRVILFTTLIVFAGRFFTTRRFDALTILGCLYLLLAVFMRAWSLVFIDLSIFDPTGLGWIYRLAEFSSYAVILAIVVLFVRDSRRHAQPAAAQLLK